MLVGILAGVRFINRPNNNLPTLILNNTAISVEIADTPEKIAQGLSDQPSMPRNSGMLFLFTSKVNYPFWMKGMKFDLDFVFIKDSVVVDLAENVPCPKNNEVPQTITPKSEYNQVLELNSGMVKEIGLKIGDKI